jgi:dTDP-4-amino-4,6-dideoxygalactose transaminase
VAREREEELVLEVLRSGALSLGPWIDRFEDEGSRARRRARTRRRLERHRGAASASARIAGLGPGRRGDHVALSFVASANCFIVEGATPIFAGRRSRPR